MNTLEQLDPKQANLMVLTQVRKNMGHSHALQRLGYKITVQVCRLSETDGESLTVQKQLSQREMKQLTERRSVPAYQLRANHELAVAEKLKGYTDMVAPEEIERHRNIFMRQNYMHPKGGYVRVTFEHPISKKTYTGEARCHINDTFNRKISQLRAWGRIYRQLLEDSDMGVKYGKRTIANLIA